MTVLAFDTETRGLDWWDPEQRAFLLSYADDGGAPEGLVFHVDDEDGMACFREDLDRADTIVCHNLSFDVHQLRETCGIDLLSMGKELVDTHLLAQVVLPERRFGEDGGYRLKDLAKTYVDGAAADADQAIQELAKKAGIRLKATGGYYDLWRAYPEELEHYAREDARITLALYHALIKKVDDKSRRIWELEKQTAPVLIRAEAKGVAIDQAKVEPLAADYGVRQEQARAEVVAGLGEEALDGNHALLDALLEHGVPLHRKTPTGELATNRFALAEFEDQFPVLRALSEWRTASKFLATYIGPMLGRDTVHPSFWQMGAWTGRMSCSRPNMQNIPARAGAEVREMFVPRPGHCFVVCDYDSIEVRLLAHYLNDDGYRRLIEEGQDPHAWMASQIWGGEPEEYAKGTAGQQRRTEAKNVLFAIVYGAGGPRVADMLGVPLPEARALIKTIKTTLPRYLDLAGPRGRVRKKVEWSGHVTTIMGRRQPVKRDKAYVGLNALIQGSAADIMKQGAINAAELVEDLGGLPVLFVHDEIVVECPTENAEAVLRLTKEGMRAAYDLSPPLQVTGSIAYNNYSEGK